MSRHLILISNAAKTCGVEEFARQMALHLGPDGTTHVLDADMRALRGALEKADDLVINLPVVAWKKRLISPLLAAAHARLARREVTIILHEWADLALARRLSYLPLLPMATRLLFSSPEVMAQFAATPISAVVTRRRAVLPIPPNFTVPDWTRSSQLSQSLAADRAGGRLVLGQFGSIYPKKDPLLLLDAAADLVRRGQDIRVVLVGSFIGEAVESQFRARVQMLGLDDRVTVTGYVESAEELYGLFHEVDVFLYPLSEGLTSRRASVLAAALSGRPVVVSAPERADSLAHHPLFRKLVAQGTIQFVPRGSGPGGLADAVLSARATPSRPVATGREIETVWRAVVAGLEA